ncbi:MAG: hypothetical protein AAB554_05230 [Patescibacteria group bacterium]
MVCLAAACGPNVLRARGKVLHPMYRHHEGDTESPRLPRILVIYRKENRVVVKHTIVGPHGRPMSLDLLGEFAVIPDQVTEGDGLFIDVLIFSNYKDELTDMSEYDYWLELPDGRRIDGGVHVARGLKDHSMKITGAHMQPHLVTRDRQTGQTRVHTHYEEVENEFSLFSRWVRALFVADGMITKATPYVVFVMRGNGRERRYRFDFTWNLEEAIQEFNKHEK